MLCTVSSALRGSPDSIAILVRPQPAARIVRIGRRELAIGAQRLRPVALAAVRFGEAQQCILGARVDRERVLAARNRRVGPILREGHGALLHDTPEPRRSSAFLDFRALGIQRLRARKRARRGVEGFLVQSHESQPDERLDVVRRRFQDLLEPGLRPREIPPPLHQSGDSDQRLVVAGAKRRGFLVRGERRVGRGGLQRRAALHGEPEPGVRQILLTQRSKPLLLVEAVLQLAIGIPPGVGLERGLDVRVVFLPEKRLPPRQSRLIDRARIANRLEQPQPLLRVVGS